jgi:hypothetical protein
MIFKTTMEATVTRVHPEAITRSGKLVRDLDVTVQDARNVQHYRLTEVENQLADVRINRKYSFTVFVNGLKVRNEHINKLCIKNINEL